MGKHKWKSLSRKIREISPGSGEAKKSRNKKGKAPNPPVLIYPVSLQRPNRWQALVKRLQFRIVKYNRKK